MSKLCTGHTITLSDLSADQLASLLQWQLSQPAIYGYLQTLATPIWLAAQEGEVLAFYVEPTSRMGQVDHFSPATLLEHWPLTTIAQGRIFHERCEWRWQPAFNQSDLYTVLALSEEPLLLEEIVEQVGRSVTEPQKWSVSPTKLQLVGSIIQPSDATATGADKVDRHTWREVRNPHPLLYPIENKNDMSLQPRLHGKVYAHLETKAVAYTRYSHFCAEEIR